MISANAALTGSYDPLQVALSVLIAISASYAALDLAGRVTATSGRSCRVFGPDALPRQQRRHLLPSTEWYGLLSSKTTS
jgi:hypothetical protein